jgi:hypothetical protein
MERTLGLAPRCRKSPVQMKGTRMFNYTVVAAKATAMKAQVKARVMLHFMNESMDMERSTTWIHSLWRPSTTGMQHISSHHPTNIVIMIFS